MKRLKRNTLCLAIVIAALCATAYAQTTVETQAILNAKSYLTEVYGYTAQEAEDFDFRFSADDSRLLSFAPKAHPNWVYTARINQVDGTLSEATCPFTTGYEYYPGQNSVQGVLYEAKEKGWFSDWNEAAMKAFMEALDKNDIRPAQSAAAFYVGLTRGTISAAGAVQGFFEACYGDPMGWTGATKEWRDEVLSSYGLVMDQNPVAGGNLSYTAENTREGFTASVTQFVGEAPQELAAALAHPKLAGWTTLCGAYVRYQSREDIPAEYRPVDNGLVAFENGDERLLIMLRGGNGTESWQAVPVGEKALLRGREVDISYSPAEGQYTLMYPISAAERESFRVRLWCGNKTEQMLCQLMEYRHVNDDTGEGVVIDSRGEKFNAIGHWYHITQYAAEHPAVEEMADKAVPGYLDYIDANAFPKTAEACKAAEGYTLPEGYGVTVGVHLRKETSSRSTDLGMYEPCTLVQVLETVPGNPHPWAHVRIGTAEGYMSTVYVSYPGSECSMEPLEQGVPLSLAKAKGNISLKKGTGWFDGTVKELAAGTKMHVLAVLGEWLHVMVPSKGEPGWLMDVNGIDGYVKASDVIKAATSLQLDWLE